MPTRMLRSPSWTVCATPVNAVSGSRDAILLQHGSKALAVTRGPEPSPMQLLELDDLRRGWCPTVYRPMETGDGLLVRVHPPSARLTPLQARAIATAARSCGNGLIDLSGRGNLQIRGIRPATHAELVKILSAAGLDDATTPQRCIVAPLAGRDPAELIDAARLADEIDAALGTADSAEDIP